MVTISLSEFYQSYLGGMHACFNVKFLKQRIIQRIQSAVILYLTIFHTQQMTKGCCDKIVKNAYEETCLCFNSINIELFIKCFWLDCQSLGLGLGHPSFVLGLETPETKNIQDPEWDLVSVWVLNFKALFLVWVFNNWVLTSLN